MLGPYYFTKLLTYIIEMWFTNRWLHSSIYSVCGWLNFMLVVSPMDHCMYIYIDESGIKNWIELNWIMF